MHAILSRERRRGVAAPAPRRRPPAGVPAALVAALMALPAGASAAEPAAGEATDAAADEPIRIEERLTVTDTRLRDEPRPLSRVPAHVTVIAGDEIRGSGARTLQELLAFEAGVVSFDQVGNDLSRSLDLRGFTGSGTKVFLDGVPLNDPRNNGLVLELVPLAALERVEITRGSAAALAGGGAEAGVVNLWTGRGGGGGSLALAAGELGTREIRADLAESLGPLDLFLAGSRYETDGFRDNAGGELTRLAGKLGWELGDGHRLELTVIDAAEELGAPGALTRAELAADRRQAPFNRLDDAAEQLTQASASFQGPLASGVTLAANLFVRDRGSKILTTGRAAPLFGGFFLDSDASVVGSTVQASRAWTGGRSGGRLTGGLEWLDGDTDARGFFTPSGDPGRVEPSGLASDNAAERRTLGAYLQGSWSPRPRWSLMAGARWDRDEVGYVERAPDPTNVAARRYSELSLRAGVTWSPSETTAVYLSFGEGFLPPTVEELFSFPLFGSNPDLEPEDSESWELGVRRQWQGGGRLEAAAFRVDTRDEIVFDPGSPIGLFGANVNAGRARREGVEASATLPLAGRGRLFASLTLMESELLSGPNRGASLPLVPEERLAAGVEVTLPGALALRLDALWVGEQVLDNDEANRQQTLDAYAVVNARLTWPPPFARRRAAGGEGGPALFVEARNLLDESYETRGIFAFDFAAGSSDVFLTPAPGRRLLAGLEWGF